MAGLYIHIPFCRSRCHYCDFYSTASAGEQDRYADALIAEMHARRGSLGGHPLRTVYFGGGTPSLLAPDVLRRIWNAIGERWDVSSLEEATLEANPDDLTPAYLDALATLPFDRLSIGIQSFGDGLLQFMNRRHTAAQAVRAVRDARRAGFSNISVDLIYGIPGMSAAQWEHSLGQILELRPEHISAYHLTIEPGTPFGRRNLRPATEEQGQKEYQTLCRTLAGAGYEHYEISNFALPGRHARHNSGYWDGTPYLGLGPSAHSYDGNRLRMWCEASLAGYMQSPAYESETLTDAELYDEYVMTSLRTSRGADPAEVARRFGTARAESLAAAAVPLLASGMIVRCDGRYAIPEGRFLVSDDIICRLMA